MLLRKWHASGTLHLRPFSSHPCDARSPNFRVVVAHDALLLTISCCCGSKSIAEWGAEHTRVLAMFPARRLCH